MDDDIEDAIEDSTHELVSSEQVVAPSVSAIVHAHAGDTVHAWIGARRDRRVPDGGVGRQNVQPCLSEPGTLPTQSGQRGHGRGVAIEVAATEYTPGFTAGPANINGIETS